MADLDVDDLLEDLELETKSPTAPRKKPSPASKPTNAGNPSRGAKGEVDDLLDDLDDLEGYLQDDSPHVRSQPQRSPPAPARSTPAPAPASTTETKPKEPAIVSTAKCFPVYIGGSKDEQGLTPGRACDKLRCTKCDFAVKRWEDVRWSDEADYLFFRNFFPDGDKLKKHMVKAPGSCAYACQCTWKSATELTALQKSPDMRWVCGGHKKALA